MRVFFLILFSMVNVLLAGQEHEVSHKMKVQYKVAEIQLENTSERLKIAETHYEEEKELLVKLKKALANADKSRKASIQRSVDISISLLEHKKSSMETFSEHKKEAAERLTISKEFPHPKEAYALELKWLEEFKEELKNAKVGASGPQYEKVLTRMIKHDRMTISDIEYEKVHIQYYIIMGQRMIENSTSGLNLQRESNKIILKSAEFKPPVYKSF